MSPQPSKKNGPSKSPRSGSPGRSPVARPGFLSDGDKGTRLQKFLASAGVDSRRNCEEFISTGRVTVDGVVVKNPAVSVLPEQQDVRLDGERLRLPKFKYYVLNKPKGVVCTNSDPAGRPRAVDLVAGGDRRLFTVGRLDENTEGLLLITNDGALAEHLAHPRYEVTRRYRVQVAGIPSLETLAELKKGMYFTEGFFRFQSIRMVKKRGRSAFLELELREGKNREIRRLLARSGHKVMNLQRIAFGPLRIGNLSVGEFRELRLPELRELYTFIESTPHERTAKPGRRKSAGRGGAAKRGGPGRGTAKKKPASRTNSDKPAADSRRGVARTVKSRTKSTRGGKPAPQGKPASTGKPAARGKGRKRQK